MRRKHNKLRTGCRQCKQRRVKCDEALPSCRRCVGAGRSCSLVDTVPLAQAASRSPPSPSLPSPGCRQSGSSTTDIGLGFTASLAVNSAGAPVALFTATHLELLQYFLTSYKRSGAQDSIRGTRFFGVAARFAYGTPYLLDQVLACAALHKSTKLDEPNEQQQHQQREFLLAEAIHLQTRALSAFNLAQHTISEDSCFQAYLFSSLLSQQATFEALSFRGGLPGLLDRLVSSLALCRGIIAVAALWWRPIRLQLAAAMGESLDNQAKEEASWVRSTPPRGHFAKIMQLITQSGLGKPEKDACGRVVGLLQQMADEQASLATQSFEQSAAAVQRWLVVMPLEFSDLLTQRRPEALVILAGFGLIVHNARGYWDYGNSGRELVESIDRYLGSYWRPMLEPILQAVKG